MQRASLIMLTATLVVSVAGLAQADPIGTAFTYQGQLKEAGLPVTDDCDFRFALYDGETSPTQVGPTLTFDGQGANPDPIHVESGLFMAKLDFGTDIFTGEKRWLEIEVRRPSGVGGYTMLDPRQELTPAPNALYAETAGSATGGVTGSGTSNRLARFTGSGTIGNAEVYQNSQGNIGIGGSPFWGGTLPGWGPDLHVNTGSEQATVWIGHTKADQGEEIGWLSWVGGGGLMPSAYASITTEIVDTSPWPRGAMLFYTSDTPTVPPPDVDEAMRINPNGNVGIGTDAPQSKLHVGGIPGVDGIRFPDGTLQTTAAGGGSSGWVDSGGAVHLETSTDFVGIGTSSPDMPLSVVGRVRGAYDSTETEYVEMSHGGGNGFINWFGDGDLILRYDEENLVTIGQDGDVGIGTTAPASDLDVVGTAEMDGFKMPTGAASGRVLTSNSSGVGTWQTPASGISGSGSNNYIPKFTGATSVGNSALYQNGTSIGIGTTVPGEYAKLHVHSDGAIFKMTNGETGTGYNDGALFSFWSSSSAHAYLLNRENAHILFGTNNAERMRLTSDGKLAIGNTAPWCKLDVRSSTEDRVIYAEHTASGPYNHVAFMGLSEPANGYGVGGDFSGGNTGVRGIGGLGNSYTGSTGVYGSATGNGSTKYGVYGIANGSGTNYGVFGDASGGSTNYAGYFDGNVFVDGVINKSACSFKIDHPLEPAEKYLYHSVIESPDMKNVYDGVVSLDAEGEAWVQLPEWFEALNKDFRYQLTCIGGFAPVYIAEEVTENQFKVAGGKPGMKVSWQITGIRQDAYANANRLPVEEDKPANERGKYLTPAAFGLPEEMAIHQAPKGVSDD